MKNKFLKTVSMIIAFIFLFSSYVSASGLNITVERSGSGDSIIQNIKVSGDLCEYEKDEYVSLKLYNKGLSENNLSIEDYKYIAQTKVNEDGSFEFNFEFTEKGDFSFVAATPDERVEGEKYISDFSAILQLISGLNDGTVSASDAVKSVNDNNKELLFDTTLYKDYSESTKLIIWQNVISELKPNFSVDNIYEAFNKQSIISGISNAPTSSEVKSIIEYYNSKYLKLEELSIENVKKSMNDAELSTLYALMTKRNFSDISGIKECYVEAVILAKFKNVNNYMNIPEVLSVCKQEADIAAEMLQYDNLSDLSKKAFSRYLSDEINYIVSIADNETGLKGKVKYALSNIGLLVQKYSVAPAPGGSGGGGGGSAPDITVGNDYLPKNNTENFGYLVSLSDISEVEWASKEIGYLYDNGIISGKEPGKFKPNDNVTRAEITKLISLAFGVYDENSESTFKDSKKHWGYRYISSAANKGYIVGVNEDEFKPDNLITRQDMAVVLYRIIQYSAKSLKIEDITKKFIDSSEISDYARNSVLMLAEYGILNGFSDGSFKPKDNLTRAQAAVVIVKLLNFMNN